MTALRKPRHDPGAWSIKSHTADVVLEARGRTRETALARLGTALSAVVTGADDPRTFVPDEEMAVQIEAPDEEALVVAWLSELLWRLESEDLLWLSGGVELSGAQDTLRLTALGNAARYDPKRHGQGTEVKAITYHDLRFERDGDHWVVDVLVDI